MKKKSLSLLAGTCVATLLVACPGHLLAAEAPKAPEQLLKAASHVVTGKVIGIEVRSRYSEIEEGGFDYAIWCTIAVDAVEKGEGVKPGDQLVAHCFRPKTRLAVGQLASLQGHSPIPALGQEIRVYLVKGGRTYHVIHPNGFSPTNSGRLVEADEVIQLGRWSPVFTLLLPLELWVLIALIVLPVAIVALVTPRPRLRRVLNLVLAVPVALWTTGLSVGVAQFLATIGAGYTWFFHAAVMILGIAAAAPFGLLTVWLFMTAMRRPPVDAKREGTTGAAEPSAAADGGRDTGF
jgi:hypothetical protein